MSFEIVYGAQGKEEVREVQTHHREFGREKRIHSDRWNQRGEEMTDEETPVFLEWVEDIMDGTARPIYKLGDRVVDANELVRLGRIIPPTPEFKRK